MLSIRNLSIATCLCLLFFENAFSKNFFTQVHKIPISDLAYVSPLFNPEFQKQSTRINLTMSIYGGPFIGTSSIETRVLGTVGFGLGMELTIKRFIFGWGVEIYSLFDSQANQNNEYTIGYKFKVMCGGILHYPSLTKLYLLYRDNQLQISGITNDRFGYYSRNVGLGISTQIIRGVEVGLETFFTIMHAGGGNDYYSVDPQLFVRFSF